MAIDDAAFYISLSGFAFMIRSSWYWSSLWWCHSQLCHTTKSCSQTWCCPLGRCPYHICETTPVLTTFVVSPTSTKALSIWDITIHHSFTKSGADCINRIEKPSSDHSHSSLLPHLNYLFSPSSSLGKYVFSILILQTFNRKRKRALETGRAKSTQIWTTNEKKGTPSSPLQKLQRQLPPPNKLLLHPLQLLIPKHILNWNCTHFTPHMVVVLFFDVREAWCAVRVLIFAAYVKKC